MRVTQALSSMSSSRWGDSWQRCGGSCNGQARPTVSERYQIRPPNLSPRHRSREAPCHSFRLRFTAANLSLKTRPASFTRCSSTGSTSCNIFHSNARHTGSSCTTTSAISTTVINTLTQIYLGQQAHMRACYLTLPTPSFTTSWCDLLLLFCRPPRFQRINKGNACSVLHTLLSPRARLLRADATAKLLRCARVVCVYVRVCSVRGKTAGDGTASPEGQHR